MRIIAGEKRGMIIAAPKGMDTRPTLDRVKESLFGILQFEISGRRVLDLFAGSGSLGLEALSRGASSALFCEAKRETAAIVKQNIEKLCYGEIADVYCMDYAAAIKRAASSGRKFDLVFLDPPYGSGYYENALALLWDFGVLADGFIIVAEHGIKYAVECHAAMRLSDERRYRDTALSFFVKGE